MKSEQFYRKAFPVEAIQVSKANLQDAAQWCQGDIRTGRNPTGKTEKYIKVRVLRAINDRQTKAFAGDWILYAGTAGYKIYTDSAFKKNFEPIPEGERVNIDDRDYDRDAGTGQFVSTEDAEARPESTVHHSAKKGSR